MSRKLSVAFFTSLDQTSIGNAKYCDFLNIHLRESKIQMEHFPISDRMNNKEDILKKFTNINAYSKFHMIFFESHKSYKIVSDYGLPIEIPFFVIASSAQEDIEGFHNPFHCGFIRPFDIVPICEFGLSKEHHYSIAPSISMQSRIASRLKDQIVFISDSTRPSLIYRFVSIANRIPWKRFCVITAQSDEEIKKIANKNVNFFSLSHFEDLILSAEMVIGNGWPLLYALALGKTTLVFGNQGFGGIVTQYNFKKLFEMNFNGRIGGTENEAIPYLLVKDSILTASSKKMHDPKLQSIVQKILDSSIKKNSDIVEILCQITLLYQRIQNKSKIGGLIPQIVSNCRLDRIGNSSRWVMCRISTAETIGVFEKASKLLFQDCNGKFTISEILIRHGLNNKMNFKIFTEDLLNLWERKAIVLRAK